MITQADNAERYTFMSVASYLYEAIESKLNEADS